jgi:hypothetical protein
MAWNASVVDAEVMSDYMRSLELLLDHDGTCCCRARQPINEPRRTVTYLLHRKWREQAILEAVRKGTNTCALLPVIYRDLGSRRQRTALSLRAASTT